MTRQLRTGFMVAALLGGACNANRISGDGQGCAPEDTTCIDIKGDGGGGGNTGDRRERLGPGTATPFNPRDDGSSGVKLDDKGNVILDPGNAVGRMLPIIWVANSGEGTVSKIDTRTLKELARYDTYPGRGGDPSRTTVSLTGDVVVANRAAPDGSRASAVKIAGDPSGCIDRNGNGKIDTSTSSAPIPWPAGMAQSPDECVLWRTSLASGSNALPRAAGWNAETSELGQQVYVGLYGTSEVVRLDGRTGNVVKRISVAPAMPYGLVLDKDGAVWVRGAEGSLAKIDVKKGDELKIYNGAKAPPCGYGIAADAQGRVYTSGGSCVSRFTPATETWETLQVPGASSLRGLAVDQKNGVWIADTSVGLFHVDAAATPMVYKGVSRVAGGNVGAAIDFDGMPWIISQANSKAYKVNPADYSRQEVAVGSGPYTYSDMTGFQLRNAGPPSGVYRHTFLGCNDGTETRWFTLDWQIMAPSGTKVIVRVRFASDAMSLPMAPFAQVAELPPDVSTVRLVPPQGSKPGVLQVELQLQAADPKLTPILSALSAGYSCGLIGLR